MLSNYLVWSCRTHLPHLPHKKNSVTAVMHDISLCQYIHVANIRNTMLRDSCGVCRDSCGVCRLAADAESSHRQAAIMTFSSRCKAVPCYHCCCGWWRWLRSFELYLRSSCYNSSQCQVPAVFWMMTMADKLCIPPTRRTTLRGSGRL